MLRTGAMLLALALFLPGPVVAQDVAAQDTAAQDGVAEDAVAQNEEAPSYSRKGADTCLACHDTEVVYAIFQTLHGQPGDNAGPFGHGQLQCEACHGPGDAHAGRVRRGQERPPITFFGSVSDRTPEEMNGQCLGCHQANVGFGWHDAAHNSADLACVDCHTLHDAEDPVRQVALQPETCFRCHQIERSQTMKAFAHPIAEQKMACTDCHSPHGSTVGTELVKETVNETCDQCHAEKRGPYLWEHAPVAEDCTTCHNPHGSNQPAMLAKRAPLLCQGCHSQAGHPSVSMETAGLPSGTPSRFLLAESCLNCHSQVHGSNHPSGSRLMR
jgi:DmsE family decaheme c-type cytochrome